MESNPIEQAAETRRIATENLIIEAKQIAHEKVAAEAQSTAHAKAAAGGIAEKSVKSELISACQHKWGPETTFLDRFHPNPQQCRGQNCLNCPAYVVITKELYGKGKKKKRRILTIREYPGCIAHGNVQEESSLNVDVDVATETPDAKLAAASLLPDDGQHVWGEEQTDIDKLGDSMPHRLQRCCHPLCVAYMIIQRDHTGTRCRALRGHEKCPWLCADQKDERQACLREDQSKTILILGDGNFSFSFAKCRQLNNPRQLIATAYDSLEEVMSKYPLAGMLL
jgi:hypothetical protein